MSILDKILGGKKVSMKEAYAVFTGVNAILLDHPIRTEPEYHTTLETLKYGVCRMHLESVIDALKTQVTNEEPAAVAEAKRLQGDAAAMEKQIDQLGAEESRLRAKAKALKAAAQEHADAAEALTREAVHGAAKDFMAGGAEDMDARLSESALQTQALRAKADAKLQAAQLLEVQSDALRAQVQDAKSGAAALREQADQRVGDISALKRDYALLQSVVHHLDAVARRSEASNQSEMGFQPTLPDHLFERLTVGAVGDWRWVSAVLAGRHVTESEFSAALDGGRDMLRRAAVQISREAPVSA
jgi:hypothetical protein